MLIGAPRVTSPTNGQIWAHGKGRVPRARKNTVRLQKATMQQQCPDFGDGHARTPAKRQHHPRKSGIAQQSPRCRSLALRQRSDLGLAAFHPRTPHFLLHHPDPLQRLLEEQAVPSDEVGEGSEHDGDDAEHEQRSADHQRLNVAAAAALGVEPQETDQRGEPDEGGEAAGEDEDPERIVIA